MLTLIRYCYWRNVWNESKNWIRWVQHMKLYGLQISLSEQKITQKWNNFFSQGNNMNFFRRVLRRKQRNYKLEDMNVKVRNLRWKLTIDDECSTTNRENYWKSFQNSFRIFQLQLKINMFSQLMNWNSRAVTLIELLEKLVVITSHVPRLFMTGLTTHTEVINKVKKNILQILKFSIT